MDVAEVGGVSKRSHTPLGKTCSIGCTRAMDCDTDAIERCIMVQWEEDSRHSMLAAECKQIGRMRTATRRLL